MIGKRLSWCCTLFLCLWAGAARAAEPAAQGPVAPTVAAVKASQAPRIDGRLDDACWQTATHVTGFWRMENGAPEYEPTEAWICYDQDCIYVAWYCHDSQPGKIVAEQKKRGGSLRADDWVGIDVDQDFDKQGAYWFDVSAGGTQVESIPGGAASQTKWRGDWQAATVRVSDGWQAEVALPLSIFRYPRGQSTFGFVLIRRLSREDDWSTWPAIGPSFELTRQAAWTGLQLPAPKQGPTIMPYSLAEFGGTGGNGATGGVDVKNRFRNGLQGVLSYNPDFRDIEDVVESIDFTYVERYLPEYRPFFVEGSGYAPDSSIFYSRRIPDFDAGVKLFGQTGPHGIGALITDQFGQGQNVVLNDRYALSPTHDVGLGLVQHMNPDEPQNTAYALSTGQRYPKADGESGYWANWLGTLTQGPGGEGRSVGAGWHRDRATGLSWDCGWSDVSTGFSPVLGYAPETDVHSLWLNASTRQRYDTGPLLDRTWFAHLGRGAAENGRRWNAGFGGTLNRRDQRGLWAEISAGSWGGLSEHTLSVATEWGNRDLYRNGGLGISYGERLRNPYRYLSFSQGFQMGQRLSLNLRAEHVRDSSLDDNGQPTPVASRAQYVLTLTHDITWERSLSARVVKRDDGTNVYLAFRQKTRLGTDAWVILGDPNARSFTARLAVKLVRVF